MKKINFNYTDSYVNTTSGFAIFILLAGIIGSVIIFSLTDEDHRVAIYLTITYIFGSSLFMYIVLMSLSKILQHLLCIRAYHEIKANEAGYEVNEPCYKITETKPEE